MIRTAIDAVIAALEESAVDRVWVDAYRRVPQADDEDDEVTIATAATRALIEEESW